MNEQNREKPLDRYLSPVDVWAMSFGCMVGWGAFVMPGTTFLPVAGPAGTILSMMIAGAFTGIAGAIVTLGVYSYGRIFTTFDNYGFDGISVALIGACKTSGIIFGGLLIGLLKAAGTTLQLLGISKEIAQLIQACILIFIAIQYGIVVVLNKIDGRRKESATKS